MNKHGQEVQSMNKQQGSYAQGTLPGLKQLFDRIYSNQQIQNGKSLNDCMDADVSNTDKGVTDEK